MKQNIIAAFILLASLCAISSATQLPTYSTNTLAATSTMNGVFGSLNFSVANNNGYAILIAASGGENGGGAFAYKTSAKCTSYASSYNNSADTYLALCPMLSNGIYNFTVSSTGQQGETAMEVFQFSGNSVVAANVTTGEGNSIVLRQGYLDICAYGTQNGNQNPSGTIGVSTGYSSVAWQTSTSVCNVNKNTRVNGSIAGVAITLSIPSINLTATPNTIDVGMLVRLTNKTSDPYASISSYTYLVNNTSGVTINHNNSITFANAGWYNVTDRVVDSRSQDANGSTTVKVNQLPSISLTYSTTTMDVGMPFRMFNKTSGGTAPYLYSYTINSSASVGINGNIFTFYNAGSQYKISETVTDALGNTATSGNVVFTVAGMPKASLMPISNTTIVAGGKVNFIAQAVNGTPPYLYTVLIDGNSNSIIYNAIINSNDSVTFNQAGSYTISEVITDLAGDNATTQQIPITVLSNAEIHGRIPEHKHRKLLLVAECQPATVEQLCPERQANLPDNNKFVSHLGDEECRHHAMQSWDNDDHNGINYNGANIYDNNHIGGHGKHPAYASEVGRNIFCLRCRGSGNPLDIHIQEANILTR